MRHPLRTSAFLALTLLGGALVSVPGHAATASTAVPGASSLTPSTLTPSTLTWHGGKADQQLGQRLNGGVCDLDADGLGDLTAGSAVGYGSPAYADMPSYRRDVSGNQDSFIDLPQWWSHHTDSALGGWQCVGDVNADGHDDVVQLPAASARTLGLNLFGATRNSAGRLLDHRVRNYQFPTGTTSLAATAAEAAGDLDGDGRGDVVVSQHTASTGDRTGNGRLWVLAGLDSATVPSAVRTVPVTTGAASADVVAVIDGAAAGDGLARAQQVGDVDGDGLDDLAVASPAAGTVWLVHGRAAGAQARHLDLSALDPADGRVWMSGPAGFGASLAVADDVDGDGLEDYLVGSADGLDADGGVAVVFGSAREEQITVDTTAATVRGSDGSAGYWISAAQSGEGLGYSVAGLGDLDGDGHSDLLLGAPGHDVAGGAALIDAGAAYVLRGRAGHQPLRLSELTAADGERIDGSPGEGQAPGRPSRFGQQVAQVGDVDDNGVEDYAIAAPGRSDHATARQGAVAVALRGELDAQLALAVSRRIGDGGELVGTANAVLTPRDVVDLRANLRLSTRQGVAGEVEFTVDGEPLAGCERVEATVSAPHRSFAFCEQGTSLTEYGRHVIGAGHAGQTGRWRAAQATTTPVLVVDQSTLRLDAEPATADRVSLTAAVSAASSAAAVEEGSVAFTLGDQSVTGCEAVPVVDGVATCEIPEADLTRVSAAFSGLTTPSLADPQREVTVLEPSTAAYQEEAVQTSVGLTLSRGALGYGDAASATVALSPAPAAGTVELLVGQRVVATGRATGTVRLALPRTIAVGSHRVQARLRAVDGTTTASSSAVTLQVVKATVGKPQVRAPRFKAGTRPRLRIRVPGVSNGSRPVGVVKVTVGRRTTTVKLTAERRGAVTVRLAQRRGPAIAKVRFVPAKAGQVAASPVARVKLRVRR